MPTSHSYRPSRITSRSPSLRRPSASDRAPSAPRRAASDEEGLERLQKVLAAAGLGSRRSCEELITQGRVEVDRKVISELGVRVNPLRQEIRVDGERLPNPKRVVYMLYKPVGIVTTHYDPSGRSRVVDLVPGDKRVFPIGRLDRMSEGLILVTNDGPLANLLAHPRYGIEKKYHVQVAGVPGPEILDKLRRGVRLAEESVHAKQIAIRSQHKESSVLEMVLDEGKNREIRRMLARLGHKVHQLKRVAIGKLSMGNLLPGQWRQLSWSEIELLKKDAQRSIGSTAHRSGTFRRGRTSRHEGSTQRTSNPPPRRRRRAGKASSWRKK